MRTPRWVVSSGYVVLVAIAMILASTAFLRGGHPPGSGIVNLLILVCVYPIAVYGSIAGMRTSIDSAGPSAKVYFIMAGVCLAFALTSTMLLVLKVVLGKAI